MLGVAAMFSPAVAQTAVCPSSIPSPVNDYLTALAYDKGTCGLAVDQAKATTFLTRAADAGIIDAQYMMGERFFTGNGGRPNYTRAAYWYLKAANQGHGLSQLRLGFLYAEAHYTGVPVDYAAAEKWFAKAAEQNAGDAQFRLGHFYHNYKKPPETEKAIYWLTRAAENGDRNAMYDLGRLLRTNNPKAAAVWFIKAAERDLLQAQMMASTIYTDGDGVEKSPAEALRWAKEVITRPNASPFWLNKVADAYMTGAAGTNGKNYEEARILYSRAALRGDAHALARLGKIYAEGLGIEPNFTRAQDYLKRAADRGNAEAQALLKKLPPARRTP